MVSFCEIFTLTICVLISKKKIIINIFLKFSLEVVIKFMYYIYNFIGYNLYYS